MQDLETSRGSTSLRKSKKGDKHRIAIMGEEAVGKSALTTRFISKRFMQEYITTIEEKLTKKFAVDERPTELNILDTAGLPEFRAVRD